MEKEQRKELKDAVKDFKKISDSSWSGDDRMVIETAIYIQLKKLVDILKVKKRK